MAESTFHFKQFSVKQHACAMKVGTDGVLLGAWTDVENTFNILDAGCGTGLIALMLAQKCIAQIDAIDIDESAVKQAANNIQESKWKERIEVFHTSLQKQSEFLPNKYDLIVCNPPFFHNALKPENEARANARHSSLLPFNDLIDSAFNLLNPVGRLSLIIPIIDADSLITMATAKGFYIKRQCTVIPKPNKIAKRLLIEFSKLKVENLEKQELIIENEQRHHYTNKYISLTKDYYLNF
ncbi:MAG: methyltransferase [Bacteroidetes bacterium]|nr:methyltransferase [Bacteroidota bacterium]HET6244904.1 methyltransferase [Bacteroidia bacterium]